MSIKLRLLLSYVGMIIIPVIVILLLNSMFIIFGETEQEDVKIILNPMRIVGKYIAKQTEINRKLNIEILNNKEKLIDPSYLKKYDQELEAYYSGLIVREDEKIVYVSKILEDEGLLSSLPAFNEVFHRKDFYRNHGKGYILRHQNDFYLNDGSKISMFIVSDTNLARRDFNKIRNRITLIVISVLILTTFTLTFFIYKSIIRSIKNLEYAANEIKKGNLDYEIKKYLNDEIGDLSLSLEEMRLKLKNSLEVQKKYEENRKNLISNISHDLKTPIMSIKGYIEGIRDGIADTPDKMEKYINTIYEKARHMEGLIDELFLFSKLDLQKVSFDFQTIDIIEFLKYSVEDLSFELEKIEGKISLNDEKESIFVKADLQKLKRVIVNIVGNSVKYKGESPLTIDIFVKKEHEEVIVQIKDNGKGISKEDLPYIFDRFYRADQSRNTSVGGSGLGLAISKQIIEKHGGKMWAESKINIGTSIFFSLKICKGGSIDEKNIDY
ncbi:HAMP domain-containing histidine kinase [Crassaminicella thermophila]|uniref:histidine kinase n=1 Tax=Crassaminicella thermophila TaxID=2599308 RepID=A0A5C0SCR3_CRATE|nr:HAMP domain-containing sensor histidine kinase [Crassaminicella thermophila]QEK11238.1 HAMP domain-containing histidine kinase [Crassaminicella thermophila]